MTASIKYEERIVGPLSIKQSIYLGGFLMAAGFVYFNKTLSPGIKLPLALILAGLGGAFAFLNLGKLLKSEKPAP